jgi:hypothetical protein
VAAVNADGTIEDKRKVLDFDESIMDYIEKAASVRGTAPALTLSGGNDQGTINEGEQFELHMPPAAASAWKTKYIVRALNAEKQEVDIKPTLSGTKITCTAPQVDKETELEIQLQTWTEGQLASEWSKPFTMTVHDVPINPPTITSPADNATGIGETPTITINPGSADNPDAVHDGTKITITNDPTGNDEVASYTAQGAVTSWKVPAGQIQTNKHLYIHAQTSWNGVWSPKVTIDVFTSAQFTFIEAPKILAPQEGSEVMWNGLKCVLAPPVIEAGGTLKHRKTIVEIYKGETKVQTVEATSNLLAVNILDLERATDFKMRAQFDDEDRGSSAWSDWRAFRTKNIGNGVRVEGGIAVLHTFNNGQKGYLIVPPGSQRTHKNWGQGGRDTSLYNISVRSRKDIHSGAYNTAVLCSSAYSSHQDNYGNIGSPAAAHCNNFIFEGHSDFFLPNKQQLATIIANKNIIDAADETTGSKFSDIYTDYIWTSSEHSNFDAWNQRPKDGLQNYGSKNTQHWVIPCRAVDLNGNPITE